MNYFLTFVMSPKADLFLDGASFCGESSEADLFTCSVPNIFPEIPWFSPRLLVLIPCELTNKMFKQSENNEDR